MLVPRHPEIVERVFVLVFDFGAGYYFRADEPGPVASSLAAKCLHADSGYRCEDDVRWDFDIVDPLWFLEIHLYRVGNRIGRFIDVDWGWRYYLCLRWCW